MKNKQSSVDFYRIESQKLMIKAIRNEISNDEWRLLENELGNQAKAMHENNMKSFAIKAVSMAVNEDIDNPYNLDELYNETFGGNNE